MAGVIRQFILAGVYVAASVNTSRGAEVDFARDAYVVVPGESLMVEVLMRTEAEEPDDLFSFGVKLVPDSLESLTVVGIEVPEEVDFFGLSGPGAYIEVSDSAIGVKAYVDVFAEPLVAYGDSLLATFELRYGVPGEYALGLDFFRSLGASEAIFLSGDGTEIDGEITFGTTMVRVVELEEILADLEIEVSGVADEDVDVRFRTIVGISYVVQATVDLVNWSDLVATVGDGEEFSFRHLGGGGERIQFYRVLASTDGG